MNDRPLDCCTCRGRRRGGAVALLAASSSAAIGPALGALAMAAASVLSGCAGYQLGRATLFPAEIRTVYVPVFQSDDYRRYLGEQLTEAVIKELERRAFKVVHRPDADSTLRGRIVSLDKRVLGEDANDFPRNLALELAVEVTWTDRFGRVLMQHVVRHDASFVPEAGQSLATAQQQAIERTARQIVGRMEVPW